MAIIHEISATSRKDQGKGASRRLRHTGQVPAVIYGGKGEPANIQFEHNQLWHYTQNEWFYASILDLQIDGKKAEKVLLRDMQRHPYKQQIMHLDFQRVVFGEVMRLEVPLHFINQETSPAGKRRDAIISHAMTSVEVECLPKDIPEFIEVDLGAIKVGDTIHLSEVKLPAGIIVPELKLGKEHDTAVAYATVVKEEVEEEVAESDSEAAEDSDAESEDEAGEADKE